ncbi:MAG: host specificity protein [Firmicutes bacterium]|nr:host specificity protein [Bacillota bacterium]
MASQNRLKDMFLAGKPALGTMMNAGDVSTVECMETAGFVFLFIDCEHGPFDDETTVDLIRVAELAGLEPVVRIADLTHKEVQRAVDAGAKGLVVPALRKTDDYRRLVDLAKFPPEGNRGFSPNRGSGYGFKDWAKGSVFDFMKASDERLILLPQCETVESLEAIEEITAIEGIDGIFIGPFDLSISMGIPGDFANPRFVAALDRIRNACRANGKMLHIFSMTAEDAKKRLAEGYDGVTVGLSASILAEAYRNLVKSIR